MKCFIIQSDKGSNYKIVINYRNDKPIIYIGGSKHYCISITGFILDIKSGKGCHDLHIRNVNFTHKATDMMKALLYFVRIKQKEIGYSTLDNECKITFIDTSENQFCGNLSSYYLAFEQKTWYEKDFGAYLINNTKLTPREKYDLQIPEEYLLEDNIFDVVNMYKDQKEIFQDEKKYKELKLVVINYVNIYTNKKISDQVNSLYDSSLNFQDFFKKIKETHENKCKELNLPLWLDQFIKVTLNFKFINNQTWKIDCNKINEKPNASRPITNDLYKIKNCEENLPGKYLSINQTGSGEKKKLTARQRQSYENPNWIGWEDMNVNEYRRKDRTFLKNLKKSFNDKI